MQIVNFFQNHKIIYQHKPFRLLHIEGPRRNPIAIGKDPQGL